MKKEDLSSAKEIIIKDMDEVMVIIDGFIDINSLKKYSDSIFLNNKLAFGKNKISNHILDYKFLVSKDAFFQINNEVTNLLYSKVLEYAGDGDIALDLYSGTGTIGIILSKKYKKVISVEINKEAVECAREINNISNIEFKCGDANVLVNNMKADLIVVDPARSGLSLDGIKNIINVRPKKIIYISCNPITLARDVKMLKEFYNFKDITLFDMFPWTYHVEAITLLERK